MVFVTFPIKSTICGCNATLGIKSDGFRIENPSVFIVITIDRLEAVAVICGNRVIPFQQQKTFQKDSCEQIKVHCESQRFLKHRLSSSSQARTLCGLSFVICRLQNSQNQKRRVSFGVRRTSILSVHTNHRKQRAYGECAKIELVD